MITKPSPGRKSLNRLLGARIAQGRNERELSRQVVAEYLEISEEKVSAIEAGDEMISAADVALIADLFEVNPDWFYDF